MKKLLTMLITTILLTSCFSNTNVDKNENEINKSFGGSTIDSQVKNSDNLEECEGDDKEQCKLKNEKIEIYAGDIKKFKDAKDGEYVDQFGGKKLNKDIINKDHEILYFYSENCTHCKSLNEYFKENNTYNKISFEKREVSNPENFELLKNIAVERSIEKIGVPFMKDESNGKIVIGIDSIKKYIEKKNEDINKELIK